MQNGQSELGRKDDSKELEHKDIRLVVRSGERGLRVLEGKMGDSRLLPDIKEDKRCGGDGWYMRHEEECEGVRGR